MACSWTGKKGIALAENSPRWKISSVIVFIRFCQTVADMSEMHRMRLSHIRQ